MPRFRSSSKRFVIYSTVLSFLILVFTAFWVSAASRQDTAAVTTKDPAIDRGRKQFQESCGFCHGADASGARGPDLLRSSLVAHDVKGDKIGEVIRQGRPDKGMPPLPLTDTQIFDIAAFLQARRVEVLDSSGVPSDYPVEKLLTGNVEAGKAFFEGQGGCKSCHSPTGDLAGVSKKYSSIEFQSRMLYPDGPNTTPVAFVTLPSGQQIKGPVKHIDDFVIALRDDSGTYRSFSRDQVKLELHDPLAAHRELLGKLTQTDVHNLFAYIHSLK